MRLGRYEIIEPLGAGGMAEVWRARTVGAAGFARDVALKVIRPELGDDPGVVSMFIDEACLSAKLNHPNIVATLDFGFVDGRYFIAFELVDGIDLAAMLRSEARGLPMLEAVHIAAEVAAALGYAATAPGEGDAPLGLVHRDVNPSNVLVTLHGQVKLGDFGIAKALNRTHQTRAGDLKGKLVYMSPEQAWGRSVDARSDVYALGLTLYELLHGHRAIDADNEIAALEAARHGRRLAISEALPPALAEVLRTATATLPEHRFPDHASFRAALLPLLDGASTAALQQSLAARVAALLEARALRPRRLGMSLPVQQRSADPATLAEGTPKSRSVLPFVVAGALALGVGALGLRHRATPVAGAPAVAGPVKMEQTKTSSPPAEPTPVRVAPVLVSRPPATPHRALPTSPQSDATVRIKVDPWADLWLGDRHLGMTPLRPLELAPGHYEIVAKNPSFGTRHVAFTVRGGESRLVAIDLEKP